MNSTQPAIATVTPINTPALAPTPESSFLASHPVAVNRAEGAIATAVILLAYKYAVRPVVIHAIDSFNGWNTARKAKKAAPAPAPTV